MLTSLPDPYTESWPNTVAICAIMFNETARDVKEFIEYYRYASGGMHTVSPTGPSWGVCIQCLVVHAQKQGQTGSRKCSPAGIPKLRPVTDPNATSGSPNNAPTCTHDHTLGLNTAAPRKSYTAERLVQPQALTDAAAVAVFRTNAAQA